MGSEEDLRIASRDRVPALAVSRIPRIQGLGDAAAAVARVPLPLLLIVAVAFGVAAIFARSVHDYSVMPDELGYVKQALAIARTGLPVGPGAFYFNSWAELLPVISAPIFGSLSMAHAFYVAHTVYALVLASTAIPACLLARELRLGPLAAYLVAALSVAVPQLVIAGEVMTDVVAYPVFVWAVLAMVRALDAPSAGRDTLAIAAILLAFFARTQFFALGPILVVAAVIHQVALSRSLRQLLYSHRVLWVATGLGALGAVAMELTGAASSVFGSYFGALNGSVVPPGTLGAGLEQLNGNVLAICVIPFTLAAAWALATALRPRDPARHAFAVVLALAVPVFVVMVGSFQVRFMGATTDRYLFYLAPLMFAGAATWVVDRRGSPLWTVLVGAAVAWMLLTKPLHPAIASIINPSFFFHRVLIGRSYELTHALGLQMDPRVVIAIVASGLAVLALMARRRLPTWQALLAVMVPVLAYGVVNTGYTMAKLRGALSSVAASNPTSMEWIDRAVPSNASVGDLIAATGRSDPMDWYTWWHTSFWNETVRRTFFFPGSDELAQGFLAALEPDLVHGRLTGLDGVNYLVKLTSDHQLGLRAPLVTTSVATGVPLALYKLPAGAPLQYGTHGVDGLGELNPHFDPFIRIFGAGASGTTAERVSVVLRMTYPGAGCPCDLSMGSRYGDVHLPRATLKRQPEVKIVRTVTIRAGSYAQLDLAVRGQHAFRAAPPVRLMSVSVVPVRGS